MFYPLEALRFQAHISFIMLVNNYSPKIHILKFFERSALPLLLKILWLIQEKTSKHKCKLDENPFQKLKIQILNSQIRCFYKPDWLSFIKFHKNKTQSELSSWQTMNL